MRCVIYQVRNTPPFSIIRELTTAHDIDRIRATDKPGRLSFRLSLTEASDDPGDGLIAEMASGSPFDSDGFREGDAVIDWSSEGISPTLWFVQRLSVEGKEGQVDVSCVEWRQLMYERTLPLRSPTRSRSAAAMATQLLLAANARNPTFIRQVVPSGGLFRMLPLQPIEFGGMNLGQALDEAASRTNSEWWVDYRINWRHCDPSLRFAYRRGGDRRYQVHLTEGVHLTSMSYSRDAREVPRVVRFIQAGGQSPADTPAAAVATSTTGEAKSRSVDPGFFQPTGEADRRRYAVMQNGPALQTELIRVLPQGADNVALQGAALKQAQLPVQAFQAVELVIRQPKAVMDILGVPFMTPGSPWSGFDLGDTIKVRLSSPQFFAGADLDVRIMAMQPDEEAGEMAIVAEVQA